MVGVGLSEDPAFSAAKKQAGFGAEVSRALFAGCIPGSRVIRKRNAAAESGSKELYDEQDGVHWFRIGFHAEYDRLIG